LTAGKTAEESVVKKFISFAKKICKCIFSREDTVRQYSKGDNSPNVNGNNINITKTEGNDSPIINGNNNVYKK
jgi:hypothetical protein